VPTLLLKGTSLEISKWKAALLMKTDSDPILLEALRQHGEASLAEVYSRYHDRLERIVDLRLDPRLAGRVDAADVLQETFVEASKRLSRFLQNPTVAVFVWLRGVALDTLIHVHRRHLAQMRDAGREVSLHLAAAPHVSSLSLAGWLIADLTSPSHAAMRDELANAIEDVLNVMDPADREVLVLRHFEGLSNDEVASVIGVKKAAASRRYMRALKRLREAIDTTPGFDSDAGLLQH
jgi:RNA polymerase sigma-70 factor (ECF subfamily)